MAKRKANPTVQDLYDLPFILLTQDGEELDAHETLEEAIADAEERYNEFPEDFEGDEKMYILGYVKVAEITIPKRTKLEVKRLK